MVVRTSGTAHANLQVHLDGNDTYWVTSRIEGGQPGTWHWPPRAYHLSPLGELIMWHSTDCLKRDGRQRHARPPRVLGAPGAAPHALVPAPWSQAGGRQVRADAARHRRGPLGGL
ncbi:hypothetical protein ACWEJ6_05415 [Nonomuraea sp. NPDC004702]